MRPKLTTRDINRIMRGSKYFLGAMPLNALQALKLPRKKNMPIKLIANLQPDSLEGSHWVAIVRNKAGAIKYYDSTGRPPPPTIKLWIEQNSFVWNYSNKVMQKKNDLSNCGYLCIEFLKRHSL
jgi:hypothetical protein